MVIAAGDFSCGVAMRVAVMLISSGAAGAWVSEMASGAGVMELVWAAPGIAGARNRLAIARERIFFKC